MTTKYETLKAKWPVEHKRGERAARQAFANASHITADKACARALPFANEDHGQHVVQRLAFKRTWRMLQAFCQEDLGQPCKACRKATGRDAA